LKSSREDVITAGEMARKYRRRARFAAIGIGVGAVLGFALGFLLFK
jgi:high-affinity Fe2+/Pb2+ permease